MTTANDTPIYLLPGMTAQYPVFSRLVPMLANPTVVVSYPVPQPSESLASYAARLAGALSPDSYLAGTSFGGMVALEAARHLRPRGCIIISSVRCPAQLPPWFRVFRPIGGRTCSRLLRVVGDTVRTVPSPLRTRSTMRLTKLAGSTGHWHRWATSAVLSWQQQRDNSDTPVLHIHGDADRTFPIRYVSPDIVVLGGGHVLPITHPHEVARAMNLFIQSASSGKDVS